MSRALLARLVEEADRGDQQLLQQVAFVISNLRLLEPAEQEKVDHVEAAFWRGGGQELSQLLEHLPDRLRGKDEGCADMGALQLRAWEALGGEPLLPPAASALLEQLGPAPTFDMFAHSALLEAQRPDLLLLQHSVLAPFRSWWLGMDDTVGSQHVANLQIEASSFKFPGSLVALLDRHRSLLPPLCSVLRAIVEKESPDLVDSEMLALRLWDQQSNFLQLSNRSTERNSRFLQDIGVAPADAKRMAVAIYTWQRERMPNEVVCLSRLQRAERATDRQFRSVDLSRCGLDADATERFVGELLLTSAAEEVDMSGNNIHVAGAPHISNLIVSLPTLRRLRVGGNTLLSDGVRMLAMAVRKSSLEFVDLAGSHAGDVIQVVSEAVGGSTLTGLDASCNGVTAANLDGVETLVANLKILSLSSNPLGDAGARHLARCFTPMMRLRHLDVSNTQMTTEGARVLLEALEAALPPCGEIAQSATLVATCNWNIDQPMLSSLVSRVRLVV